MFVAGKEKRKQESQKVLYDIFLIIDDHSFDLNLTDDDGWTVLHYSVRNGSYESLLLVVTRGADINLKTKKGRNWLPIAALFGHLSLCKMIIDKHNFDIQISDIL